MMDYKQSINKIFEANRTYWIMESRLGFDDELFYQDEIPAIIDMIESKLNVKYNPENPKLKKIMDVQLLKLKNKEIIVSVINKLGTDWTLTRNGNHLHLMIGRGGYYGYPIIRENFTWEVDGVCDFREKGLKSLKGSPVDVHGDFDCSNNELTSLEGCPETIRKDFNCGSNKLTSLKGCPKVIGDTFTCTGNMLSTLEYGPEKVGVHYLCNRNKLTSLKGSPKHIYGDFLCSFNNLTSLNGCPVAIYDGLSCNNNNLQSLEDGPRIVKGLYDCQDNPDLTQLDIDNIETKIEGQFRYGNNHGLPRRTIDNEL
jgi:hypothetical protein